MVDQKNPGQIGENITTILITEIEHQKQLLSEQNTLEGKQKSVRFSSFSFPNPSCRQHCKYYDLLEKFGSYLKIRQSSYFINFLIRYPCYIQLFIRKMFFHLRQSSSSMRDKILVGRKIGYFSYL